MVADLRVDVALAVCDDLVLPVVEGDLHRTRDAGDREEVPPAAPHQDSLDLLPDDALDGAGLQAEAPENTDVLVVAVAHIADDVFLPTGTASDAFDGAVEPRFDPRSDECPVRHGIETTRRAGSVGELPRVLVMTAEWLSGPACEDGGRD